MFFHHGMQGGFLPRKVGRKYPQDTKRILYIFVYIHDVFRNSLQRVCPLVVKLIKGKKQVGLHQKKINMLLGKVWRMFDCFPPVGIVQVMMHDLHRCRGIDEKSLYLSGFFLLECLIYGCLQRLYLLLEHLEVEVGGIVQDSVCPCSIEFQVAFTDNAFGFFLHLEHTDSFTMKFQERCGVHPFTFLVHPVGLGNQLLQLQQYVFRFFEGHRPYYTSTFTYLLPLPP